jgi:hypothetical protein
MFIENEFNSKCFKQHYRFIQIYSILDFQEWSEDNSTDAKVVETNHMCKKQQQRSKNNIISKTTNYICMIRLHLAIS